jgi:hypothetical protein
VHVYRQLMRPDGATREFLIDVDGSGLELVERRAGDDRDERPPASAPSAGTRPVRTPDSGLVTPAPDPLARVSASAGEAPSLRRPPRAGRGLEPGSRRAP